MLRSARSRSRSYRTPPRCLRPSTAVKPSHLRQTEPIRWNAVTASFVSRTRSTTRYSSRRMIDALPLGEAGFRKTECMTRERESGRDYLEAITNHDRIRGHRTQRGPAVSVEANWRLGVDVDSGGLIFSARRFRSRGSDAFASRSAPSISHGSSATIGTLCHCSTFAVFLFRHHARVRFESPTHLYFRSKLTAWAAVLMWVVSSPSWPSNSKTLAEDAMISAVKDFQVLSYKLS